MSKNMLLNQVLDRQSEFEELDERYKELVDWYSDRIT